MIQRLTHHLPFIVCLLFAGGAPVTSPSRTPTSAPTTRQVVIDNFTFDPPNLTITAGTKVTWLNHDDVPHTVRSNDGVFKSGALDTDETFSFVFPEPGTYPYFCGIHPHMTGTITVLKP